MADEVRNANVVRIGQDGNAWYALIGPDPQSGLMGTGASPEAALWNLCDRVLRLGWVFDPSWQPGKTTFHDA